MSDKFIWEFKVKIGNLYSFSFVCFWVDNVIFLSVLVYMESCLIVRLRYEINVIKNENGGLFLIIY